MVWENTALAGDYLRDAINRKDLDAASSARLAIENQSSDTGSRIYAFAALVSLEIVQSGEKPGASRVSDSRACAEPCKELSYQIKPVKAFFAHGDLSADAQRLAVGGSISKSGDKVEIDFSEDDHVEIDTSSGDVAIDSKNHYQKEVHYKGTAWQKTVLTSNNDTRISFGTDNIHSIEHNGTIETFPHVIPKSVGCEPRIPASEELKELFTDYGFKDLRKALKRIDRQEAEADQLFEQRHGDKTSVQAVSNAIKERGLLLGKAAEVLPDREKRLNASAENQLRTALSKMREQYGVGTPETKPFAEALEGLLKASHDKDHDEEIERLGFEARRAGLMKGVIDTIEKAPEADSQSLDLEKAQSLRMSLISIHIAGGDPALKSFVDDINQRLRQRALQAPKEEGGPFRHGAIILTPEGSTRYGGSFEIISK